MEPQSKNLAEGYVYGNKVFKEGSTVTILEHSRCESDIGRVEKINGEMGQFIIACLKCMQQGMIPSPIQKSHHG